jgi:alkylation response protein AidB-like acyl-CoA dehydrogenase
MEAGADGRPALGCVHERREQRPPVDLRHAPGGQARLRRAQAAPPPRVATGDLHVAFGVTEPDAGLDTTGIRTRAERYWREARLMRIAPIPQEMVLNYLAEHVLGLLRSY